MPTESVPVGAAARNDADFGETINEKISHFRETNPNQNTYKILISRDLE